MTAPPVGSAAFTMKHVMEEDMGLMAAYAVHVASAMHWLAQSPDVCE